MEEIESRVAPLRDLFSIIFFTTIGFHVFPTFVLVELTVLLWMTFVVVATKFAIRFVFIPFCNIIAITTILKCAGIAIFAASWYPTYKVADFVGPGANLGILFCFVKPSAAIEDNIARSLLADSVDDDAFVVIGAGIVATFNLVI